MTSRGALMMIGVIITQRQSSLREQLIYYQLSDMSSPAKDEMESSHWSDDLIEVNTEAYTMNGLPKPSSGSRPKGWGYLHPDSHMWPHPWLVFSAQVWSGGTFLGWRPPLTPSSPV